jgi:hypothetical protein
MTPVLLVNMDVKLAGVRKKITKLFEPKSKVSYVSVTVTLHFKKGYQR